MKRNWSRWSCPEGEAAEKVRPKNLATGFDKTTGIKKLKKQKGEGKEDEKKISKVPKKSDKNEKLSLIHI